MYIYIYIYIHIHIYLIMRSRKADVAHSGGRLPATAIAAGSETRFPALPQRHINGVVSKNNKYNYFGFGGIKRPF